MKRYCIKLFAILFSILLANAGVLVAQEKHEHGEQAKHEEHASEGHASHMQGRGYSEEQRAQINHMHHALEDDQKPYKEKEAGALKELNELTVREDVKKDEVFAKIDELMAAQNMIMRLRYEHLIEMRKILTDEQKVKYDENVLKRSEVR
jgi:Spy/CpxP family protein refolding chaperone